MSKRLETNGRIVFLGGCQVRRQVSLRAAESGWEEEEEEEEE